MSNRRQLHVVGDGDIELVAMRYKALDLFEAHYADNALSKQTMISSLRRIARTFSDGALDERSFPWESLLDAFDVALIRAQIVEAFKPATAAKDMAALRMLLRCNQKVGLVSRGRYEDLIDFDPVRSERSLAGRYLSAEDVGALLDSCRHDRNRTIGIRDAALILTACSTGTRRHEVVSIETAAVDLETGCIQLTKTKGGQPRTAYLHRNATAAIRIWLSVRGVGSDFLFLPVTRGGRVQHGQHLSAHQMWKMVRRRGEEAGLPAAVSTHDFRRYAVSHLLDTTDLVLVSRIVGHRSPETTARYDRRPDTRRREAVETLPLPGWYEVHGEAAST